MSSLLIAVSLAGLYALSATLFYRHLMRTAPWEDEALRLAPTAPPAPRRAKRRRPRTHFSAPALPGHNTVH